MELDNSDEQKISPLPIDFQDPVLIAERVQQEFFE